MADKTTPTIESFLTAEAARAEIARQASGLRVLHAVRESLSESDRPLDVIYLAVDALASHVGYAHVGAYIVRDNALRLVHEVGYDSPIEALPLDAGICGFVARTREPVFVSDTRVDPRYVAVLDDVTSEICVPFGSENGLKGVLNVEGTVDRPLTLDDLRIVNDIAGLLTIAVERTEMRSRHRATERRLELALSAGEVGVWTWNLPTGDVEFIFGGEHPLSGLLPAQTSVAEMLTRLDAADVAHAQHAVSLAETTGTIELEVRLMDESGQPLWVLVRGQTVHRGPGGGPAEMSGIITDITGRKRLEEERLRLVHLETARINAEEAQRVMATTIDRLADGFVSFDAEGTLVLVNTSAQEILGATVETLLGTQISDVVGLIGDEVAAQHVLDACDAPDPATFDILNGSTGRILEIHTFPTQDGVTLHLRDVTDLRMADYQRHRAETRFRALVQQAFEIIIVMDRSGLPTYISPAVERVLGYSLNELDDLDLRSMIHREDRDRVRRAFLRILRLPDYEIDLEFRVQDKQGQYRWLDMTLTNLLGDPSIQGVVANLRDVTDRHASDYSLWLLSEVSAVVGRTLEVDETIESLNRLLVGSYASFSLVAVLDEHGQEMRRDFAFGGREPAEETSVATLLEAARRAMDVTFGGESRGQYTLMIGAAEAFEAGIPAEYREVARHLASLQLRGIVIAPITLRRSLRGLLMVAPRAQEGPGDIDVETVEDIARRAGLAIDNAELYAHAREAISARDRFLSVSAHELRTPITSITGYSTMMRKELEGRKDPDRLTRYMGRIEDAGKQLAALAEDLLDVTRIRSGQMPLRMGSIEIGPLLGTIVRGYGERSEVVAQRLKLTVPESPVVVFADADRITQVLTNLIDNGLKYSPADEPVEIVVTTSADWAAIRVQDRGIGVPTEELEQIFDPFGRASNAAGGEIPGLGLGLYICRTIVEQHGGRISASSGGQGEGLRVTVHLPTVDESTERRGP